MQIPIEYLMWFRCRYIFGKDIFHYLSFKLSAMRTSRDISVKNTLYTIVGHNERLLRNIPKTTNNTE